MRTLSRYLSRAVLAGTLLVFASLALLFAFFDLIDQLGDLGKGNYRLYDAAIFVLLSVPGHVYEIFPVAALIGTAFALARLTATSEYTVIRASGVSIPRIGLALLPIGLLFAALTFIFGEFVAPAAERLAQEVRMRAMSKVVAQEFRSGLWVRDGSSFVNVKQVTPDNILRGIYIYELDEEYRLEAIRVAQEGVYREENSWKLNDVTLTRFHPERVSVSKLDEQVWNSVLTPNLLNVLLITPEQMAASTLYTYIEHLREQKQQTSRYEIALWGKLTYPFAVLVMMLIAIPFAGGHPRAGGIGLKIFMGIMLGLGFHFLNRLFAYVGALNDWSPILSATLPTAVFLLAAMAMIRQVERR
jgi:lipopolysaccharide export system permease protein